MKKTSTKRSIRGWTFSTSCTWDPQLCQRPRSRGMCSPQKLTQEHPAPLWGWGNSETEAIRGQRETTGTLGSWSWKHCATYSTCRHFYKCMHSCAVESIMKLCTIKISLFLVTAAGGLLFWERKASLDERTCDSEVTQRAGWCGCCSRIIMCRHMEN